jgi:hypothetical protein
VLAVRMSRKHILLKRDRERAVRERRARKLAERYERKAAKRDRRQAEQPSVSDDVSGEC